MYNALKKALFNIKKPEEFEELALNVYKYQFENNDIYNSFSSMLGKSPSIIKKYNEIPFMPIAFFKRHQIVTSDRLVEKVFSSSGTTGINTSKHFIPDLKIYKKSFTEHFKKVFPEYQNQSIIALLPSYIDRNDSSLLYMVNELIQQSEGKFSGFFKSVDHLLEDFLINDESPKILIGVTFALLNLAKKGIKINNALVIETGGMKGNGKELIRKELHEILKKGLGTSKIYSEYGMTELLSQAYLTRKHFECPPWMRVLARDINDPLEVFKKGKGALNIIDLANLNSCSFIASDDIGEVYSDGLFDVNGRIDNSLLRGCNLLT